MTANLATRDSAQLMERAVIQGDLSQLTPEERVAYYSRVCESLGLNPYTKPFAYLALKGEGGQEQLILYARKDCTDQLRDINHVSVTKLEHRRAEGLYIVTAYVVDREGRTDSAIGAVPITKEAGVWKTNENGKRYFAGNGTFVPLTGDALANAMMKAETKAKRRATLSLCGLGMTDESEIDSIPGARQVTEVQFDSQSETGHGESSDDQSDPEEVWKDWHTVAMQADELQVPHKELTSDAPIEKVRRWTIALQQRLDSLRPNQVGAPTEAEKAAPRDPQTGEVLDKSALTRSDLWAENRRLCDEARKRGLTGPTLLASSGEGALVQANAELAQRIENYDLDQQFASEQAAR